MNSTTAIRTADATAWTGRVEDDALLRGAGHFGDDVHAKGALAAAFVRSPHAFAKIVRVDTTAAKTAKGVVAVLTAADLAGEHYHSLSHGHPIPGRGGKLPVSPHRPVLAETRVMHVGEPVAIVVAATAAQAASKNAGSAVPSASRRSRSRSSGSGPAPSRSSSRER